ncbi:MAG: hypothetical protein ACI965_000857 [Paraglaciecola sp.]|jgi:hypothetical protein
MACSKSVEKSKKARNALEQKRVVIVQLITLLRLVKLILYVSNPNTITDAQGYKGNKTKWTGFEVTWVSVEGLGKDKVYI